MSEFYIRGQKYTDRNQELFRLACKFRSHKDKKDRDQIAEEYAKEVDRLIASNLWDYAPSFDEMLPSDYMPKSFDEYWNNQKE